MDDRARMTVGLLWKGQARRLCQRMKWENECSDYFEEASLWESTFLFKGLNQAGVERLRRFETWLQENGATA